MSGREQKRLQRKEGIRVVKGAKAPTSFRHHSGAPRQAMLSVFGKKIKENKLSDKRYQRRKE